MGELGASIITGVDGNPAAIIATQLGIPMATIRTHTPIYLEGGVEANKALDEKVCGETGAPLAAWMGVCLSGHPCRPR